MDDSTTVALESGESAVPWAEADVDRHIVAGFPVPRIDLHPGIAQSNRLRFLTVGLSFVLTFIGAKMIAHKLVDIPEHISLLIVAGILLLALGASLLFPVRTGSATRRRSAAD